MRISHQNEDTSDDDESEDEDEYEDDDQSGVGSIPMGSNNDSSD